MAALRFGAQIFLVTTNLIDCATPLFLNGEEKTEKINKKVVQRKIRKYHVQQIGLNINGKGRPPVRSHRPYQKNGTARFVRCFRRYPRMNIPELHRIFVHFQGGKIGA